jgi:hypothetical protein
LSIWGSLDGGEAASQELCRSFARRMKDEPDYSSENKEYLRGVHDERKRFLILDCNDSTRFYSTYPARLMRNFQEPVKSLI